MLAKKIIGRGVEANARFGTANELGVACLKGNYVSRDVHRIWTASRFRRIRQMFVRQRKHLIRSTRSIILVGAEDVGRLHK